MRIIHQYSTITFGASIMPTDTKKMAPKRSLMGAMRLSMRSLSTVSARMLPIMKAPSALEKPLPVARVTIPKQRPRAVTSSTSLFRKRPNFLRMVGIR